MRRRALPLIYALLLGACATRAETPAPAAVADDPVTRAWPVMGTMLAVAVWDQSADSAAHTLRVVREEVERLDSLLSNYRDDSDVSRLNAAAGSGEWLRVAPETFFVINAARGYGGMSGGAFDATVGPIVDVWGFYRESGAMPTQATIDSARALVGMRGVEFREPDEMRLTRAGMRIDLGAIGKGYAVDRALAAARAAGATRAMVDLGGNIGVLGEAPGGGAWPLGLRHPRDPEVPFAVIDADSGAVATSGDYERYFMHEGVRYAHIVDPRTGWPVQGVAAVSVLAPTGIASDALSTILFVMGPERGCGFLARLNGAGAVWVVAPERDDDPLRVVTGGPEAGRIEIADGIEVRRCEELGG